MSTYIYCEVCRDVHHEHTGCRYGHVWITLGEFPSRVEAVRKARWYGYAVQYA